MVLDTGDVAILNKRTWMVLEGGRGTGPVRELEVPEGDPFTRIDGADCNASDVVVGGHVDVNPAGEALLVQALPPVGLVQASAASAPSLLATLNRVVDELTGNRIGSAFAVASTDNCWYSRCCAPTSSRRICRRVAPGTVR